MGFFDFVGDLAGFFNERSEGKKARQFQQEQFEFQKEMAHNQVQWRVADAKKAGLHPLYALGMAPMSFSPTASVMDNSSAYLSSMGQNIDRALGANVSRAERARIAAAQRRAEALEAVQRERDAILFDQKVRANEIDLAIGAAQLARLNAPGTPPPIENVGAGVQEIVPARSTSPSVGSAGREAGSIRDYGFTDTDIGGLAVVPSYDVHERIEDNFPAQMGWFFRNQLLPAIGGLRPPSTDEIPIPDWARGATEWRWSPLHQQFLPYQRFSSGDGGFFHYRGH